MYEKHVETVSPSQALTSSYANVTVGRLQKHEHVDHIRGVLSSLSASSGLTVTAYLCTDTDGKLGLTEIYTATVQYGDADEGWFIMPVDSLIALEDDDVLFRVKCSGTGTLDQLDVVTKYRE